MSRSTQYIGLNDVGENCIVGMEETYYEAVQAEPWSSGPMIFTCLENQDGKRYGEWKRQERTPIEYSEYDYDTGIIWI